jgi:hypothetical protein
MRYDLGCIDLEQRTLQTIGNPFGTRLSPMSWEQSVTHVSGRTSSEVAEGESALPCSVVLRSVPQIPVSRSENQCFCSLQFRAVPATSDEDLCATLCAVASGVDE